MLPPTVARWGWRRARAVRQRRLTQAACGSISLGVTPAAAIAEASAGNLRPVYLLVGEESFLAAQVVTALRAAVDTGPVGFNEDKYQAGERSIEHILDDLRTVPMMAPMRSVVISGMERWEGKAAGGSAALDALAKYCAAPVDSALLVLLASKLNGSRRLMRAAKKQGFLVVCKAPSQRELGGWIRDTAKAKGHPLASGIATQLAELMGPELGPVADALERLSLYVGPGQTITADAIAAVVTRVRQETVWALVDALGARDPAAALRALHDAYDARDRGLPMLGAIAWRVRQLVKYASAAEADADPKAAAAAAGVPPFRARDLQRVVRVVGAAELGRWLLLLAEADLALKGSRRAGDAVLTTLLLDMCRRSPHAVS